MCRGDDNDNSGFECDENDDDEKEEVGKKVQRRLEEERQKRGIQWR